MASKRRTLKKKINIKRKTPNKYNKRKVKSQKKRKTKKMRKNKKLYKMQKGGISASNLVSHNLLNAARYVPHTITNAYNGLVGNTASPSFMPWEGHYS